VVHFKPEKEGLASRSSNRPKTKKRGKTGLSWSKQKPVNKRPEPKRTADPRRCQTNMEIVLVAGQPKARQSCFNKTHVAENPQKKDQDNPSVSPPRSNNSWERPGENIEWEFRTEQGKSVQKLNRKKRHTIGAWKMGKNRATDHFLKGQE